MPYPPNWLLWLTVICAFIMVLDIVLKIGLLLYKRWAMKKWERENVIRDHARSKRG